MLTPFVNGAPEIFRPSNNPDSSTMLSRSALQFGSLQLRAWQRKTVVGHRAVLAQFSSLVDCSKVEVKPDAHGGSGAFAAVAMRAGDVVESGIVRRLTNVDGDVNPYVYAWSDEVPIKTWAIGSGCATFYNTSASPNTSVTRFLESDRFEITATRDIQAGEELTHAYANLRLRTCYQGLGESWG